MGRKASNSEERISSWSTAANGRQMRSPHQYGVALRWMPLLETSLPQVPETESTSASSATEDVFQEPMECSPLQHDCFNYDAESSHQDYFAYFPRHDISPALTMSDLQSPSMIYPVQTSQPIETSDAECQIDHTNQPEQTDRQHLHPRVNASEVQRVHQAKERRKLQNRRS